MSFACRFGRRWLVFLWGLHDGGVFGLKEEDSEGRFIYLECGALLQSSSSVSESNPGS